MRKEMTFCLYMSYLLLPCGITAQTALHRPSRTLFNPAITGSPDRNFVLEFTSTDGTDNNGVTKVTYMDGLGRVTQTVTSGMSPTGTDIVSLTEQDALSRTTRTWKHGCATNTIPCAYVKKETAQTQLMAFFDDEAPYTDYSFETAPDGRLLAEMAPGATRRNKDAKKEYYYTVNCSAESHLGCSTFRYDVRKDLSFSISQAGKCADGTYRIKVSTDEDGNSLYEFTDMGGRLYLRRTVINGNDADTYFLRNGMGETVAVLTPKLMEEGIDKENVEKYAYLYVYDGRHRISASKTPGSGWKRFRYDAADRLVMEQDANMDETGICKFHIYDKHGRECIVVTASVTRIGAETLFRAGWRTD